jgi:hypothetical protein
MKKAKFLCPAFTVLLLLVVSASAGPITVEEAGVTWEPGLASTDSPDIDPRIIGEYTSIMFTAPLVVSDDMVTQSEMVGPRFIVEYASTIGHFGLGKMPMCQSDIVRDGSVNSADLDLLAVDFGRNNCIEDCPADLTPDGDVDGADLAVMAEEFLSSGCPLME